MMGGQWCGWCLFLTATASLGHGFSWSPISPNRLFRNRVNILKSKSDSSTASPATAAVWTKHQLLEFADDQGLSLSMSTLGPGYRSLARSQHNESLIMGYVEGFVRPTGQLLHLDKMEVFQAALNTTRRENDKFTGGGTILGVGLLLGYLCLLHGREQSCTQAEFLAIDDADFQHKRLVKYYTTAGFKVIKYVGEDMGSIPDRLVWGGCGTLLRQDIDELLRFWSSLLERSKQRQLQRQQRREAQT